MSKAIRVQDGNLIVELDSASAVSASDPSSDGLDARIHMSLGGIISESTGGVGGFEADTWAAGDKAYLGVYNDETGQYAELVAHGSTFGAGSLNHALYTATDVAPLDITGDYKTMMRFDSTSAANTFVDITDGSRLRIWDDTEIDNVEISHDGTNLVFTPTTTSALAIEGLYFDMLEIADPAFAADIGRGRLWVQNTTPNQLIFTDDAGNDVVAASLASTVNISGTPVDNQVAIWTGPNTIEGDANFTWTGTTLAIAGAGAQLLLPLENDPVTPTLAFGDGDSGFYESADDVVSVTLAGAQRWNYGSSSFEGAALSGPAMLNTGATSTQPTVIPIKSDTNTGMGSAAADQLSLIAGSVEMLRLVETGTATTDQVIIAPAGIIGTETTPALAFGDGDTGFYESADDQITISAGGDGKAVIDASYVIRGATGSMPALVHEVPTATNPSLIPNRDDLDTGIGWNAADQLSLVSGAKEMLRLVETGTATTDQVIISPGVVGGSAAATPTLAFGDGDTGFWEQADDELRLAHGGSQTWFFDAAQAGSLLSGGPRFRDETATTTNPTLIPYGGDGDTGVGADGSNSLSLITGGVEAKRLTAATVQTTNATQTEIISIAVPTGGAFGYRINVIGIHDTTEETVFESIFGAVSNTGGTAAIVGSDIVDRTEDAGASTWVVTVGTDTANLTVDVTGEAAHNIDWKVSVELLEV